MIENLHLKNWKSFKESTLYIDPLTFVIGTNASGKSNILDALLFLNRLSSGLSVTTAINGDTTVPPLRGGMEWIIRKGEEEATLSINVGNSRPEHNYTYSVTIRRCDTPEGCKIVHEKLIKNYGDERKRELFIAESADVKSGHTTGHFRTDKQGPKKRLDLNSTYSVLSQLDGLNIIKEIKEVGAEVRRAIGKIFILDPIPNHIRNYSALSAELHSDASNIAGVLAGLTPEQKKEIEKNLTSYAGVLPAKELVKIWAEKIGRFGTDAMLYCEEKWTDTETITVDARGMSDGTLRFIAIAGALLTRPESSLLIIEEIDNGLHPSRTEKLINVLLSLGKERGIDVLCTTHNPVLLDKLGPDIIPFVSYVTRNHIDGASEIHLLEDKPNLAKLMASESIGDMMTNNEI